MRQAQQTASDPDGWPTTAVKISRYNVLDGHARSQAGKDQPIVRTMVEKDPGTVTMATRSSGTTRLPHTCASRAAHVAKA